MNGMADGKQGTRRIVTIACYHHRGADPDDLCAIQAVLQDEQERVLDFRVWRLDGYINLSDTELERQVEEYIGNLGRIDLISFIEPSLEYENELCSCCGELTQTVIDERILEGELG